MTEAEIQQHYAVKVDFVICKLYKKTTIKNILSKYIFVVFCFCFVLFYASLGEKNQKLLSRFLCCKSSVLVLLNVFSS